MVFHFLPVNGTQLSYQVTEELIHWNYCKNKKEKRLNKKLIICFLIVISLISLGLKLYLVDFSIPVNSDNLGYTLNAIAHTNGDFSQSSHRAMGWSIFVSPFFSLIDSDNFIDYSNTIRALSIGVATFSIPMMYLVGRKFFDARYSLLLACLFAFEPHLNYNSGLGLSEPLFHLAIIGSFYFILNEKTRFVIISLFLAGIAYWIRINGVFVFIVITIIYFATFRKSPNLLRNYGLGIVLFLLVISPVLFERNEEFGDPFYSAYKNTIFSGSTELIYSGLAQKTTYSALDYIEENGVFSFVQTFILQGFYNSIKVISVQSFPYLFILIPFGILFSFRVFDKNPNYVKANWIFILVSLASLIVVMAMLPDRRHLLFMLPFLMIFSVIPIQRVTEYGLNTWSFSRKRKDIFIIAIIITIILLSSVFTTRYGDHILESEELEFSEYALNNFEGVVLRDWGGSLDYVGLKLIETPEKFKNHEINSSVISDTFKISGAPYGKTLEELISDGEKFNLKYIIANEKQGLLHPFTDELYNNYNQYTYLKKVFDSDEFGFKKLKIKVFEINYEKFNKSLND